MWSAGASLRSDQRGDRDGSATTGGYCMCAHYTNLQQGLINQYCFESVETFFKKKNGFLLICSTHNFEKCWNIFSKTDLRSRAWFGRYMWRSKNKTNNICWYRYCLIYNRYNYTSKVSKWWVLQQWIYVDTTYALFCRRSSAVCAGGRRRLLATSSTTSRIRIISTASWRWIYLYSYRERFWARCEQSAVQCT